LECDEIVDPDYIVNRMYNMVHNNALINFITWSVVFRSHCYDCYGG